MDIDHARYTPEISKLIPLCSVEETIRRYSGIIRSRFDSIVGDDSNDLAYSRLLLLHKVLRVV